MLQMYVVRRSLGCTISFAYTQLCYKCMLFVGSLGRTTTKNFKFCAIYFRFPGTYNCVYLLALLLHSLMFWDIHVLLLLLLCVYKQTH